MQDYSPVIPGFAFYYALDPQQLIGMLAGGMMLMRRLHAMFGWAQ